MIYNLTSNFTRLSERTGTIQNSSAHYSIEVSDKNQPGTGIVLKPGETFSFSNQTLYARCEGTHADVRVVPFMIAATGGSGGSSSGGTDTSGDSSNYDETAGDIWDTSGDTTGDSTQTYDPDWDSELDNIFG